MLINNHNIQESDFISNNTVSKSTKGVIVSSSVDVNGNFHFGGWVIFGSDNDDEINEVAVEIAKAQKIGEDSVTIVTSTGIVVQVDGIQSHVYILLK